MHASGFVSRNTRYTSNLVSNSSLSNHHELLIVLATHGEYNDDMRHLLGCYPFFVFDIANRRWLDDHKSNNINCAESFNK